VFHAARRTSKSSGTRQRLIPHPIFDTQVAAMVLGYGDSISYDQLVARITATRSTSRTASPTGRAARCPTRNSPTQSPT